MSKRDLKQDVSGYFAEQSLPRNRATRLSDLAFVANAGETARSTAPRWRVFVGSIAASVFLSTFLTAILVSRIDDSKNVLVDTTTADSPQRDGFTLRGDKERTPRLVAVSTTAEWCPMCPRMVPVYEKLLAEYGERSVLFVVFDLTDEAAQKQSEYLANTLGINWLCEQRMPTGTIKLIDREKRTVLASATQPDQLEKLIGSLNKALP